LEPSSCYNENTHTGVAVLLLHPTFFLMESHPQKRHLRQTISRKSSRCRKWQSDFANRNIRRDEEKKKYVSASTVSVPGVYNVSSGVSQFTVNVAGERRRGLQLRGDILIKCYHRGDVGRETVFACQFHTCAVADYTLSFTRQELDVACNGKSPHPPSLFPTRPGIAAEY
jgi:hypothetical protein